MSKLEQKRQRAAREGYIVAKTRKNVWSDNKDLIRYGSQTYRSPVAIYAYRDTEGHGDYMVMVPDSFYPVSGLTYRQAVQVAYMLSHKRKSI